MKKVCHLEGSSRPVWGDTVEKGGVVQSCRDGTAHTGELRQYSPPSWFDEAGRRKVVASIAPDLPNLIGSVMVTLTVDQKQFTGPAQAFAYSRARVRKLAARLRKGVRWDGQIFRLDVPHAVKVEFHENGWPHYHLVFLTRVKIPPKVLNRAWGLGRTHVKRIADESDGIRYLLKSPIKKECSMPSWLRDLKKIRIWQPGKGFMCRRKPETGRTSQGDTNGRVIEPRRSFTIGQRMEKWARSALLRVGNRFQVLKLSSPFRALFEKLRPEIEAEGRILGERRVEITSEEDLRPWVNGTVEASELP